MRLVLGVVVAAATLMFVGSVGATPTDPFLGTWWAVDKSDNSLEQLTFGAGGSVFFRDNSARVCGGAAGFITDTGSATGDVWTGSGSAVLRCPATGQVIGPLFVQFTLSPDGTLVGSLGPDVFTRTRPNSPR